MKKFIGIVLIVGTAAGIGYWLYNRKKTTASSPAGSGNTVSSLEDQIKDLIKTGPDATAKTDTSTAPAADVLPSGAPAIAVGEVSPAAPAPVEKPVDLNDWTSFAGAIFYEHPYKGYREPFQDRNHGWAVKLPPGLYASDIILKKYGIVNDQVSGVQLDPGIKVIMYKDANFKGTKVETDKDIDFLKDVGFDNAMSSVEVIDTNATYGFSEGTWQFP